MTLTSPDEIFPVKPSSFVLIRPAVVLALLSIKMSSVVLPSKERRNMPAVAFSTSSWSSLTPDGSDLPSRTVVTLPFGPRRISAWVPRPNQGSSEKLNFSSLVVLLYVAFRAPGWRPMPTEMRSSMLWIPPKLKSLISTVPSPFASGCRASPLLKRGSSTSCLNTFAKFSASPTVTLVNGIFCCWSPWAFEIEVKRSTTWPSMPMISLGPAVLKFSIKCSVEVTAPPGVASNE